MCKETIKSDHIVSFIVPIRQLTFLYNNLIAATEIVLISAKMDNSSLDCDIIEISDSDLTSTPKLRQFSMRRSSETRNDVPSPSCIINISDSFDAITISDTDSSCNQIDQALQEIFGLRTLRPMQLEVITAAMERKDCLVLLPTGGGKSLCYQLPAVVDNGVTVVICPLKSLIYDQITKLRSLKIKADHLCGDRRPDDIRQVYEQLKCSPPAIKLLYLTPERLVSSLDLQKILTQLDGKGYLSRFIIDEAHCISKWGHDLRPSYTQLDMLRQRFKAVSYLHNNIMSQFDIAFNSIYTHIYIHIIFLAGPNNGSDSNSNAECAT